MTVIEAVGEISDAGCEITGFGIRDSDQTEMRDTRFEM